MDIRHEIITKNFSIRLMRRLSRSVPHWHQRMELLMIESGFFAITIQGKTYSATPGDVFVVRTGQIHSVRGDDDNCSVYVSTFNAMLLYGVQPTLSFPHSYISGAQLEEAGIREEIFRLFAEMLAEKQSDQKCSDILIQARILQIYGLLTRHFEAQSSGEERNAGKFRDFQIALQYISENFRQPITLREIAQQLNYSSSYVSSMFLSVTGINFKAYLDSIRVNEASEMLKSTALSVSRIAADCGFENIRTFNNVFRKITGMTPTEFRK